MLKIVETINFPVMFWQGDIFDMSNSINITNAAFDLFIDIQT